MAIFDMDEYENLAQRPDFDEAWDRLPVIRRIDGLRVRWLGPLVDLGHAGWIGELTAAAYGYLEDCGWSERLPEGSMVDARGRTRPAWAKVFAAAARDLAFEGSQAGPEGHDDRWASWLAFELAESHGVLRAVAEEKGWDR
jgi:hypothetical protein